MIEAISAITLATHDMRRAVRFYASLGFEGGDHPMDFWVRPITG